jgi:hypothetical protein
VISANATILQEEYRKTEYDKQDNNFVDGTVQVVRGGSGCPYVSTWNGTSYVLDNNLLLISPNATDVTDRYVLQQALVQREDGTYSLMLSEFESEHSYFDYVQLLAVDHAANVSVAVSPDGEILTYVDPHPPLIAVDNDFNNVRPLLRAIDGEYYEGYNGSYVTLVFPRRWDATQTAKLVLRADPPGKESIHIQVYDKDSGWKHVATVIPRIHWSTEIVDLSQYLPDSGSLKVRLYFTDNHKVDFVGLDVSPPAPIDVRDGQLISAVHSLAGNVTESLLYDDAIYGELVPGQNIQLAFTLPQLIRETRTHIIMVEGHYYTIES